MDVKSFDLQQARRYCAYLVSSFSKKRNDIFATRHNSHSTLLSIAPIFHRVHQFGPITLSLELGMNSDRANLHHSVVSHCSDAAEDLIWN